MHILRHKLPPRRGERAPLRGFTLIEVLVSTAILVVIVLMISMVFRATTTSWDSGVQRANATTLVRTAIGALQRELRMAVCGTNYPDYWSGSASKGFEATPSRLKFLTLPGGAGAPVEVEFDAGKTLKMIVGSTNQTIVGSATTGSTSIKGIAFTCQDEKDWVGGMPAWVGVKITLDSDTSFGGVTVFSPGPDGEVNTEDDIIVR